MSAEVITKIFIQDVEDRADIVNYGPVSDDKKVHLKTEFWDNSSDTCSWQVIISAIPTVTYKRIDNHGELWLDGIRIGRFKLKP